MMYRDNLDKIAKETRKEADELIKLQSSCHPEASLTARYWLEEGSVILSCVACGESVARVQVASRSSEAMAKVKGSAKAEAKASAKPKPRARKKVVKKKAKTRARKKVVKKKAKTKEGGPVAAMPGPQKMGESARRNRAHMR